MPDEATVYVNGNTALIASSHLKVMLDTDYLAMKKNSAVSEAQDSKAEVRSISEKVIREVVLPEIEKEVNGGKNFSTLRQIFHAMILSTWFKRNMKKSLVGRAYTDKNKVIGIDLADKEIKGKIWSQYVEAFKKGAFNYIKEEMDEGSQEIIPRKYFSGGYVFSDKNVSEQAVTSEKIVSVAQISTVGSLQVAATNLNPIKRDEREGEIGDKVISVVKDIESQGIAVQQDGGKFLIREAVEANGGKIQLANGGSLRLENGVLIIIDERFKGMEHAGRGSYQLAVYASNEQTVRHELAELEMWVQFAVENGIMSQDEVALLRKGDNKVESLGDRIRRLTNKGSNAEKERWRKLMKNFYHKAHIEGLKAEGRMAEAVRYAEQVNSQGEEAVALGEDFDLFISSNGDIKIPGLDLGNGGGGFKPPTDNGHTDLILPSVIDPLVLKVSKAAVRDKNLGRHLHNLAVERPELVLEIISALVGLPGSESTDLDIVGYIQNISRISPNSKPFVIIGLAMLSEKGNTYAARYINSMFKEDELAEDVFTTLVQAADRGNKNASYALGILFIRNGANIYHRLDETMMNKIIDVLIQNGLIGTGKYEAEALNKIVELVKYAFEKPEIRQKAFHALEQLAENGSEAGAYYFIQNVDDFTDFSKRAKLISVAIPTINKIKRHFKSITVDVPGVENRMKADDKFEMRLSPLIFELAILSEQDGSDLMQALEKYGNWQDFNIYRPLVWTKEIRDHVLKNRLANKLNHPLISSSSGGSKGTAVVVYPKSDHNNAFLKPKSIKQLIDRGYSVLYYEVASPQEMVEALRDGTKNGQAPLSFLLVAGHGTPDSIQFGNADNEEALLTSDHIALKDGSLSQYFNPDAEALLISCSTGAVSSKGINMVQAFANSTGISFAGPDKDTSFTQIHFDREGEGRYEFSDDAKGVMASPVKSDVGGIDLNSDQLRLQETGGRINFDSDVDVAMLNKQIDGFSPVVFSITPMGNPQVFFGAVQR